MAPGFVIAHSSGLSLVRPGESLNRAKWNRNEGVDLRQGWLVDSYGIRRYGFPGLITLPFVAKAVKALLAYCISPGLIGQCPPMN